MADRWQYVHEGPVHFDEVANVTGQDWEDVWCDLIEGMEEVFDSHVNDDDVRVYEERPLPDLSLGNECSPLLNELRKAIGGIDA